MFLTPVIQDSRMAVIFLLVLMFSHISHKVLHIEHPVHFKVGVLSYDESYKDICLVV